MRPALLFAFLAGIAGHLFILPPLEIHSKSEVNFTSLFSLHYHKRTVPLCSEYSSANTAHKKCEKALAKLKEAIKDLI